MTKKRIYGIYPKDEDKFANEYIAVVGNKIVSHGKEPAEVLKTAKQIDKNPVLTKVPTRGWREQMIL
jgi:hypothetical protein